MGKDTIRHSISSVGFGGYDNLSKLLASINGYLSTLEHDTEMVRKVFSTPLDIRIERFGLLLDALKEEYTIKLPTHFLTESITTKFLLKKLAG